MGLNEVWQREINFKKINKPCLCFYLALGEYIPVTFTLDYVPMTEITRACQSGWGHAWSIPPPQPGSAADDEGS